MRTLLTPGKLLPVENTEIADRLETFALMLELVEANPYTIRAYRRAAETIRGAPRAGRGARAVGPGARAPRDRPGDRGAAARARRDRPDRRARRARARARRPTSSASGATSGWARRRSVELARRSACAPPTSCARRPPPGGCATCPGSARRPRRCCSRRSRARRAATPAGTAARPRAGSSSAAIAAALGGEAAGDVRRWRDACERLAVVCAAADPDPVLARFAALPQIVALIERGERRAVGVTVEGVPVELVAAEPGGSGPRSSGRRARPRTSTALEPLPDAPDEAGGVPGARACPGARPSCASSRSAASRRRWSSPARSAATCTATRPGRTAGRASRRWPAPLASAATSTSRSAITRRRWAPCAGLTADDVRRQGEEIAAANELLAPFRVLRGIECDILPDGRLDLPDDVLAELDWVQASVHGGQRMPARGDDRARRGGAAQPVVTLPQPPDRPLHQPPSRERARPRADVRGRARAAGRARGQRPPRPARPERRARPRRLPPASRSSARPTRTRSRGLGKHDARGGDGAPRLGDRRNVPQHAGRSGRSSTAGPSGRAALLRGFVGGA